MQDALKCNFDNYLCQVDMNIYYFRCCLRLSWPGAIRGPVEPVDLPAMPLPRLPPSCPVQEGTPLLPVMQVSPKIISLSNLFSPKQENTAVEQLQDLQADVCGRAQPGVGEDGGVDRVALQVRRERLH